MKLKRNNMLVYGFGVNDADYKVTWYDNNKKRKTCPLYTTWRNMIQRCYDQTFKVSHPTYNGCSVTDAWKYFSTFRDWMITQDWEGNQLDKDLLVEGNKIYGPDTCLFVSGDVNRFIMESVARRGLYPVGVSLDKTCKYERYVASVRNLGNGATGLGSFATPEEAHAAWYSYKCKLALVLSEKQTDHRISKALLNRYKINID